jgi:excisionase family DNA binding protein
MTARLEQPAAITVPTLLSVAAAANVLGCSTRTLRRRIADGSLPAVLEHDRTMIRGDELRAYIEQLQRPAGARAARRRQRPRARGYDYLRE